MLPQFESTQLGGSFFFFFFFMRPVAKYVFSECFLIQFTYHISSIIRQSFSFQNNPKDLDLSCKTDLDLWDCLGRIKLVLLQNFIGLI